MTISPAYGSPESVARGKRGLRIWKALGAIAAVTLIVGNVLWAQFITDNLNRQWAPVLTVTDPQIIGSNQLCADDTLTYEYALHAEGTAEVGVNITVWSKQPPQTAIYSKPRVAILVDVTDTTVREVWPEPDDMLAHELLASLPGDYELRLSFRNVYEARRPVVILVPFSILSDVEEGCE